MPFGLNQISEKTPAWANWVFRIALYSAAVITIVLGIITQIPDHIKVIILQYTVEGVALIHALSKLFGVTISDDPTDSAK